MTYDLSSSQSSDVHVKPYKLPKMVDEVDFNLQIGTEIPMNERAMLHWDNINYFVPAPKKTAVQK